MGQAFPEWEILGYAERSGRFSKAASFPESSCEYLGEFALEGAKHLMLGFSSALDSIKEWNGSAEALLLRSLKSRLKNLGEKTRETILPQPPACIAALSFLPCVVLWVLHPQREASRFRGTHQKRLYLPKAHVFGTLTENERDECFSPKHHPPCLTV